MGSAASVYVVARFPPNSHHENLNIRSLPLQRIDCNSK